MTNKTSPVCSLTYVIHLINYRTAQSHITEASRA